MLEGFLFVHRRVLKGHLLGGCGKLAEKPHFMTFNNAGLVFTKSI
jgi:hypothetical protein